MKATEEQLKKWNTLKEVVSIQQMARAIKMNPRTITKVLNGEKVRLCNFAKIHKYFTALERKVKRLNSNDD